MDISWFFNSVLSILRRCRPKRKGLQRPLRLRRKSLRQRHRKMGRMRLKLSLEERRKIEEMKDEMIEEMIEEMIDEMIEIEEIEETTGNEETEGMRRGEEIEEMMKRSGKIGMIERKEEKRKTKRRRRKRMTKRKQRRQNTPGPQKFSRDFFSWSYRSFRICRQSVDIAEL